MSGAPTRTEPRNLLLAFATAVGAALPGAFLTMLFDSIGKDPIGPILYLAVLLIPALFGFAVYALALHSDSNNQNPPLALAAGFSLAASVLAFIAALRWFIP